MLLFLVALFAALYLLEMNLGRWKTSIRFVKNPWETATRYVGISHFVLAFAYTLTSRKMRLAASWIPFFALLGAGGVLCWGYGHLEAVTPVGAAVFFYAYFVAHDSRDQLWFCRVNGDAPAESRRESLRETLKESRSLRAVYAGTVAVLLLGVLVGGGYGIVILHVTSWYVFMSRQLATRSAAGLATGSWTWLRSTAPGFRILHAGSLVLFVLAGAVWAYAFGNDGSIAPFSVLLAPRSFPYWTILHVTVSFGRK